MLVVVGAFQRCAADSDCRCGRRLKKSDGKCTVPMNMEKVAPDCGHDTECPGIVKGGVGRTARTDGNDGTHDAAAKALKWEKWCQAVR